MLCLERSHSESISLQCKRIDILSVRVDGEPATFTIEKSQLPVSISQGNLGSIEEDAGEFYKSARSSSFGPNLTIQLPPNSQTLEEHADDRKHLEIDISYKVSLKDSCGLYSRKGYVMTLDTVGSASGWMPCLDSPESLIHSFELHLIVSQNAMAISSGELKGLRKSSQMPGWNIYHYQMPCACAPGDVAFVMGSLKCESASTVSSSESGNTAVLNQFIPRDNEIVGRVDYVFSFNRFVLDFFADIFGVLPTPSFNVVYLPDDVMPAPLLSGIGFLAISSSDIPSSACIEASQDLRYKLAFAFAKQWFGYHVRPSSFNDLWIIRGLQHWLGDQFMQSYIGKTEYIYRKWQRHNAVAQMDNGEAPPLAFHGWRPDGCPWGAFFGTEDSDPSQFFSKKAAVVVSMVENRAGDQLFKKQVETVVRCAGMVAGSMDKQGPGVNSVDSKEFLLDLSKAGDFRAEVNPFMERWIYGSGAPIVSLGVQYQKRGCMLDVGLKQLGSEASFNSSLSSEMEASKEKVGISGIVKVNVQEGSGVRVDHPLHLGTKGYLFQTVKVNPEVKKIAGKRGRKKKSEEALVDAKKAALQNAQHPVQYVRLDSTGEFLGQKFVHQPIRMVVNKLKNSRQIDAQAEAVQELLKAAKASLTPLETLSEALEDKSMHWMIRCDAANALSQIYDNENGCVGPGVLMSYYKKRFWHSSEDTPVRIRFASIEEYWVTRAVIAALGRSRSPSGYTDFEVISFILESVDRFWSQEVHIDSSHLLVTFVEALGNLRCDENEEQLVEFLHEKVYEKLVWLLKMDLSVNRDGFPIGRACLASLVSMTCSGSCPKALVLRVGDLLHRYCNDEKLPSCIIEAGYKAVVRFKTAWQGCECSISWCIDMLQKVGTIGLRFARDLWTELVRCIYPVRLSSTVIQRLADLITSPDIDVEVKHLAFIVSAICTKSSIYISEIFADAKPSLIKLNAITSVTNEKKTDSPKKLKLPLSTAGPTKTEDSAPKKLKLPLSTAGPAKSDDSAPKKLKLKLKT